MNQLDATVTLYWF